MKLVKLNLPTRSVLINPESVTSICEDIMNNKQTQIRLSQDVYVVNMSVAEVVKLIDGKISNA